MRNQAKILIAYDGINPVKNLVRELKEIGLPKHSEILVLSVVDGFVPPSGKYSNPSLSKANAAYLETIRKQAESHINNELARAKKTTEKAAKALRSFFRGWTVRAEACIDTPAWAIVKKADTWNPDLIVMGSHSASPMARFFLGSVTQSVLIHSKVSVHIVRRHRKTAGHPVKIMIGMDGSADAQKLLNAVSHRAWPPKTAVRLVSAFDEQTRGQEKHSILKMEAPFVKKLENLGLNVSEKIQKGTAWKVLVSEADRWGADCIFVGARGLGAWQRFLLGSVSNAVASRAHCSVEVVRSGRREIKTRGK